MKLSIVIPAFNERPTIREIVERVGRAELGGPRTRDPDRGRRLEDGTREILRELDGRPASGSSSSRVTWARERRLRAASRGHDGRSRPHPGRRSRVRPGGLPGPARADPRGPGRRRVRIPLPRQRRTASCFSGTPSATGCSRCCRTSSPTSTSPTWRPATRCSARELSKRWTCESQRFGIEPELTAKLARMRARIYEVPISLQRPHLRGRQEDRLRRTPSRPSGRSSSLPLGGARQRRRGDHAAPDGALSVYNRWLHDRVESWLGRRILEVGSGVGNQTRFFADRERVVAIGHRAALRAGAPHAVRETGKHPRRLVPVSADPGDRADLEQERIDSIVCMNVLEHIEDDAGRSPTSPRPPAGRAPRPPCACACPPSTARSTRICATTAATSRGRSRPRGARGLRGGIGEVPEPARRPRLVAELARSQAPRPSETPAGRLQMDHAAAKTEEKTEPSFGMSLLVLARKP